MADTTRLKECIKRLQYADPLAFHEYQRELEKLEVSAARDLVQTKAEDLARMQGFAQACAWLLSIVQEALARPKS